jgi:hypothetical protein
MEGLPVIQELVSIHEINLAEAFKGYSVRGGSPDASCVCTKERR